MLKHIDKKQLRVGMFVEAFEGSCSDNRLKEYRFLLKCREELNILRNSNVKGIFINISKGLDVLENKNKNDNISSVSIEAIKRKSRLKQRTLVAKKVSLAAALLKAFFDDVNTGAAIRVELIEPVIDEVARSMAVDPEIFINITRLKTKDRATFLHCLAVSGLMIRFAQHLKLDPATVSALGMSGLLHDIGKIGMPTRILTKEGPLTDEEIQVIRRHPLLGYDILLRGGGLPDIVLDVCLHHHERPDGKGYPYGIKDEQISLYAKMAAICDVYDALTSVRPYKKSWTPSEATSWMLDAKGVFDRDLLHQFITHVV
jgi:HD-GYP domain-containing protein (c-di-GMP phosphodiesterase class II)